MIFDRGVEIWGSRPRWGWGLGLGLGKPEFRALAPHPQTPKRNENPPPMESVREK